MRLREGHARAFRHGGRALRAARPGPGALPGGTVRQGLHFGELLGRPRGRRAEPARSRPGVLWQGSSVALRDAPRVRDAGGLDPAPGSVLGGAGSGVGPRIDGPERSRPAGAQERPALRVPGRGRSGPPPGPPGEGLPLAETALPHGAGSGARRPRLHRRGERTVRRPLGQPGPHPERNRGRVALPARPVPPALALVRRGDAAPRSGRQGVRSARLVPHRRRPSPRTP